MQRASPRCCRVLITFSEDLHTVVLSVADEDVAVGHDRHTLQALELSLARSPAAEGPEEGAVGVEDLDAVVAAVRHEDVALVVHGHAPARKREGQEARRWRMSQGTELIRSILVSDTEK